MFTDEMIISMAIEEAGELVTYPINHPKEIKGNHIGYLCDSLVRHGYLTANSLKGYQLTPKGREAILWEAMLLVRCKDKARAKSRMEGLERIYTEISQQIDEFEVETVNGFS